MDNGKFPAAGHKDLPHRCRTADMMMWDNEHASSAWRPALSS